MFFSLFFRVSTRGNAPTLSTRTCSTTMVNVSRISCSNVAVTNTVAVIHAAATEAECRGGAYCKCVFLICRESPKVLFNFRLSVLAVICLLASCVYLVMRLRKNRPATQYSGTAQTDASVPLQANTGKNFVF